MTLSLKQARRMVAKSRRRVWRFYRERGTPISPPQGMDPTGYALWMAEDPMHHHSCTGRAFVPVVEEFRRRFDALNRMEALASERAWQMAVYRAAIQVSPIDGAPIIGLTDDFTIETIELPALDHGQDGDELLQDIVEYYADSRACVVCGAEMDWIECDHCGGEGGFDNDALMEEDPLWYDGVEWEDCGNCQGKGGWWQCYRAPHSEVSHGQ